MNITNEIKKQLVEERERSITQWDHGEKFIDHAITTLPAGVFALTIAFRQSLVTTNRCLWLLQSTWALLAMSILVVMIGNLYSINFLERHVNNIIKVLNSEDMDEYQILCRNKKPGQVVKRINIIAVVFFSLGILSLAAYTIFSI